MGKLRMTYVQVVSSEYLQRKYFKQENDFRDSDVELLKRRRILNVKLAQRSLGSIGLMDYYLTLCLLYEHILYMAPPC